MSDADDSDAGKKNESSAMTPAGAGATSPASAPPRVISVDERLLAAMRSDLELRTREAEARSKDHEHRMAELSVRSKISDQQHEYALKSLEAQKEIMTTEEANRATYSGKRLAIGTLSVMILGALCFYCLHLGYVELVKDIVKVGLSLAAGGVGGYGMGRVKGNREAEERAKRAAD